MKKKLVIVIVVKMSSMPDDYKGDANDNGYNMTAGDDNYNVVMVLFT